ncbi:hypothetical protein Syun_031757 [Stephania yunnanensis]|uniref:ATP-dependent Clp protease proteolytic subunit n=1 Tax=Stephania yunnanensis TaxID=152371 RepID=A0AAP0E3Y9_9MAGN
MKGITNIPCLHIGSRTGSEGSKTANSYSAIEPAQPETRAVCIIWTEKQPTRIIQYDGQAVDSEISNQLIGLMVYLSLEDENRDLYLFINSPGGVMIHQPASSFYEAQTGEFVLEAEELLKLRETLTRVYVQRTGNPLWVVSEDMERDVFMSATEAQAHGIVDLVAVENTGDFT